MTDNKIKYDNPFESDFKFPLSIKIEEIKKEDKSSNNSAPPPEPEKNLKRKIQPQKSKDLSMSQIGFMCFNYLDDWIENKANERLYKRTMKKDKKDICNKLIELGIKHFEEIEKAGKSPFEFEE